MLPASREVYCQYCFSQRWTNPVLDWPSTSPSQSHSPFQDYLPTVLWVSLWLFTPWLFLHWCSLRIVVSACHHRPKGDGCTGMCPQLLPCCLGWLLHGWFPHDCLSFCPTPSKQEGVPKSVSSLKQIYLQRHWLPQPWPEVWGWFGAERACFKKLLRGAMLAVLSPTTETKTNKSQQPCQPLPKLHQILNQHIIFMRKKQGSDAPEMYIDSSRNNSVPLWTAEGGA